MTIKKAKAKTTKKRTAKIKPEAVNIAPEIQAEIKDAIENIREEKNEAKTKAKVKESVRKIKKIGVDEELDDEETGEEIEQYKHPELVIENEHRHAFNYITELIQRKEHECEDGRIITLTTKFCVSDRALGKTINGNIELLYNVSTDDNYTAAVLARNWNENASQVRPYYEDLLRQFIWEFWKGEGEEGSFDDKWRQQWFLEWRPLYRGIVYNKQERIKFIDLFNPSHAKKRVAQPLQDLIFDEFIPSKDQREEGKGYQPNELKRYSDVEKSCRRKNPHINKVFFGNPNDPWWNIPYLTNFTDYLEKKQDQYWRERPDREEDYNQWTWHYEKVVEYKEGKGQLLTLKKMKGDDNYEFDNYEAFNWDIFYSKREELGIRKWTNGWEAVDQFNGLARFYDTTEGEYIFVEFEWLKKHKPNHAEKFSDREEIITDDYTFMRSMKPPHLKTEIEKRKHINELKDDHEADQLKYLDLETKQKIHDYISTGRTRPRRGEKGSEYTG